MEVAFFFLAIILVVGLGALISGRRFGTLALALGAGSVISGLWAEWLSEQLEVFGFGVAGLPAGVLAAILLTLAPVLVLILGGPKYSTKLERALGSLAIGILTAAFLVQPLGKFMHLEGEALSIYELLSGVWVYVVTIGLVFGVIDLLLYHGSKQHRSRKKH